MASTGTYFGTPKYSFAAMHNGAETDLLVPTGLTTVIAGGANGTKVYRIGITITSSTLAISSQDSVALLYMVSGQIFDKIPFGGNHGNLVVIEYDGQNLPGHRPPLYIPSGTSIQITQTVNNYPCFAWAFGADA